MVARAATQRRPASASNTGVCPPQRQEQRGGALQRQPRPAELAGAPIQRSHLGDTLEQEQARLIDAPIVRCHVLLHASFGMSMTINYVGITTPFEMGSRSGNVPE
jgi:hypothetical protein